MELFNVIKYEGDNDTIIWKYPIEDFNIGSQLIVHESQEAIFFLNGQALDCFKAGKYALESENLPILSKLINIPSNNESQFHCEVYFINKVEHLGIRWGTDTKIQYMEPKYNFPLSIGANGEMAIDIDNAKKLLIKLVGTESILSKEKLISYFKAFLLIRLKPYLSKYMRENKISIFEIDEKLDIISSDVKDSLLGDFQEYGINLRQFFITTVVKPDGDPQYERFKELHFRQYADIAEAELNQKVGIINQETEKQRMVIHSEGVAEKRKTEGYTYQEERGFDVASKIAENEGAGNFTSAGIGLGVMSSVGGAVNNTFGAAMTNVMDSNNKFCPNCKSKIDASEKFCGNCGISLIDNKTCPKCGYTFRGNEKFCPECGTGRG